MGRKYFGTQKHDGFESNPIPGIGMHSGDPANTNYNFTKPGSANRMSNEPDEFTFSKNVLKNVKPVDNGRMTPPNRSKVTFSHVPQNRNELLDAVVEARSMEELEALVEVAKQNGIEI